MFRRKKKDEADLERGEADDTEVEAAEQAPAPVSRPQGPWDVDDAPEDEVNRIDLGGLLVPVPPQTEVRVDVSPEGEVVAATLVQGDSTMQVNAFAAPRRSGIWGEVRAEISEALTSGGGSAKDVDGAYGPELHGAVPVEGGGLAPARFIGVDGPRWFLRALLTGPAAQDATAAAPLEQALTQVVVVRGTEAMAVRDPLPLRLPKEVVEQASGGGAQASGGGAQASGAGQAADDQPVDEPPSLAMPERGPEITELH